MTSLNKIIVDCQYLNKEENILYYIKLISDDSKNVIIKITKSNEPFGKYKINLGLNDFYNLNEFFKKYINMDYIQSFLKDLFLIDKTIRLKSKNSVKKNPKIILELQIPTKKILSQTYEIVSIEINKKVENPNKLLHYLNEVTKVYNNRIYQMQNEFNDYRKKTNMNIKQLVDRINSDADNSNKYRDLVYKELTSIKKIHFESMNLLKDRINTDISNFKSQCKDDFLSLNNKLTNSINNYQKDIKEINNKITQINLIYHKRDNTFAPHSINNYNNQSKDNIYNNNNKNSTKNQSQNLLLNDSICSSFIDMDMKNDLDFDNRTVIGIEQSQSSTKDLFKALNNTINIFPVNKRVKLKDPIRLKTAHGSKKAIKSPIRIKDAQLNFTLKPFSYNTISVEADKDSNFIKEFFGHGKKGSQSVTKEIKDIHRIYANTCYPKVNAKFKNDIVKDAFCPGISSTFCIFHSVLNQLLIIYPTESNSLEFYDLIPNKRLFAMVNAHNSEILSCRHFLQCAYKRDLLLTSSADNIIKLWDLTNSYSIILTLDESGYSAQGKIYSCCLLFANDVVKTDYLITSNSGDTCINIYEITGHYLCSLSKDSHWTNYIDAFEINNRNYILQCNDYGVNSFLVNTGKIFKRYNNDDYKYNGSYMAKVHLIKGSIILFAGYDNGEIRLWNFFSAVLIRKIFDNSCSNGLRCMLIWNNTYLIIGGEDNKIKIINFLDGKFIQEIEEHTSAITAIEKVNIPQYNDCFFTHGKDQCIKCFSFSD